MTKRNLLIDEYPLLVLPSLAKLIGLNEAIALQQLHYWIENPKGGVELDGHRWVYNTYEQWQEDNFPFWSVRTVIRVFTSLEKMELVISKQQASYDRKKYYRIHYDKLASWRETDCHNADLQNGKVDGDKVASSLTETTPETNQIIKDSLIEKIESYAVSVFNTPHDWHLAMKRRLNDDSISITRDASKIIISGLSAKQGQFTEAQIWTAKYCKSFANTGLQLKFRE